MSILNSGSGDTIVEIKLANRQDVDAAYAAAKSAQRGWADRLPGERAQMMYRAAAIVEERYEEITSWLVRESGSTRIKATIEIDSARGIIIEAASFPSRIEGRILAAASKGQESRSIASL